jgi:hypothetical protein
VTQLNATLAGVAVWKATRLEIGTVQVEAESATLPLRWEATGQPALFPTMEATLEAAPLTGGGRHPVTQLGLIGEYRLPFGVAGQAGDALLGRRVVEESVDGFLARLVTRLEEEVATEAARIDDYSLPQGRHVSIVLPEMRSHPGGMLAVKRRLLATPGVTLVRVRPGMADVVYDPELIRLRAILALFEEDGSPLEEPATKGEKAS